MGRCSKVLAISLGVYFFLAFHFYRKISEPHEYRLNTVWLSKDQIARCLEKHFPDDHNWDQEVDHQTVIAENSSLTLTIVREVEIAVRKIIDQNEGAPLTEETFVKPYSEKPEQPLIERFYNEVSNKRLYHDSSQLIDQLIQEMSKNKIVDVEDISNSGTSLKFKFNLEGGIEGMFKPKREEVDFSSPDDLYYWHEFPRHYAEVAAFHLDRVLGWNRAPPTIGYELDIEKDILPVAYEEVSELFYTSPAGNTCVCGVCDDCPRTNPVCSRNGTMEGALILFFPDELDMQDWKSPWRRAYKKPPYDLKAWWEENPNSRWEQDPLGHCKLMETEEPIFFVGRNLLDIIDQHIFDFLTGNMDRHSLSTFGDNYNDPAKQSFLIYLDNDSGFGKPFHDEVSIAAPLFDCCKIRLSTVEKLLKFTPNTREFKEPISEALRRSLRSDPLGKPMLGENHIISVDRRVTKLIEIIHTCLEEAGGDATEVIIDDGL